MKAGREVRAPQSVAPPFFERFMGSDDGNGTLKCYPIIQLEMHLNLMSLRVMVNAFAVRTFGERKCPKFNR